MLTLPNSSRPLTHRAQHALELADQAADALKNDYVGTEHLLLGLLDEKTGPAAQILGQLGVTSAHVREELLRARGLR